MIVTLMEGTGVFCDAKDCLSKESSPVSSDKNYVKLRNGFTYYQISKPKAGNTSKNLVVCMHGIAWWSFCFDLLVKDLVALNYTVLTFDFYGRGQSDAPKNAVYDAKLFLEQVEDLFSELGVDSKVILIGMSIGGSVASIYTAHHPDRVDKLILIGPSGTATAIPFMAKVVTIPVIGYALFSMFGKQQMLNRISTDRFRDNFADPDQVDPQIMDLLVTKTSWQIDQKEGYLDAFHSTLANFPINDCYRYFEEIGKHPEIQVLLIWGKQDSVVPFVNSEILRTCIPHATLIAIDNGGHAVLLEKPSETNQHIIKFLEGDNRVQEKLQIEPTEPKKEITNSDD